MKRWKVVIYSGTAIRVEIPLDHEYATEEEAEREAEDIADQVYQESDDGWTLVEDSGSQESNTMYQAEYACACGYWD